MDMDYQTLRHLADTWGLIMLTVIFLGVVAFVLRPGARKKYDKNAQIPLNED